MNFGGRYTCGNPLLDFSFVTLDLLGTLQNFYGNFSGNTHESLATHAAWSIPVMDVITVLEAAIQKLSIPE